MQHSTNSILFSVNVPVLSVKTYSICKWAQNKNSRNVNRDFPMSLTKTEFITGLHLSLKILRLFQKRKTTISFVSYLHRNTGPERFDPTRVSNNAIICLITHVNYVFNLLPLFSLGPFLVFQCLSCCKTGIYRNKMHTNFIFQGWLFNAHAWIWISHCQNCL